MFSVLEPSKRLPSYRGAYRGVMRLHLGLVVPEPGERQAIRIVRLLEELKEGPRALGDRIVDLDAEVLVVSRQGNTPKRLSEIPGIGALTAAALVVAIDKGEAFDSGRDLAAWLGLVPRQSMTGGRPTQLGISKRGNAYVRRLFIHRARAVMRYHANKRTRLGQWLRGVLECRHRKIAVVALANRLVRIALAALRRGVHYTEFAIAR